jgi:hypothetical protein
MPLPWQGPSIALTSRASANHFASHFASLVFACGTSKRPTSNILRFSLAVIPKL